jgi:hypothetical protein
MRMNLISASFSRLLFLALTAWGLGMIAPDFYRVFDPLNSFGLAVDNDGRIIDVVSPFPAPEQSPASRAGLAVGDRIDLQAMRCIPLGNPNCRSLVALLGGLGGAQTVLPGQTVSLVVIPTAGPPSRTVQLQAAPAPLDAIQRTILLADTIVGIIVVALAASLVWTHPGPVTWGFFLYAIWFNPGQTYAYYALIQPWPLAIIAQEILEALARGAAYAGLLLFALRFADEPGRAHRTRWVLLIGMAMTGMTLASYANLFGFPTEAITRASFLIGYVLDALALIILFRRRRELQPVDEQRMRWVIWGCLIGIPAFITAEILQSSSLLQDHLGAAPSTVVIGLLYLLHGAFAYFVWEAVRHGRVVSVSVPLRHGTIIGLLTILLSVPVVYAHEMMLHYREELHFPEWAWVLIAAPILSLLITRLHEVSVDLVDHAFNFSYHATKERFEHGAAALLRAERVQEIDRLLVEVPVEALQLSSGAVFRQVEARFILADGSRGWDIGSATELEPGRDEAVLCCLFKGEPIRLERGAWSRPGVPAGVRAPCIAVPVRGASNENIAVILYGPHEFGTDLHSDERELLQDLASGAAAAYERLEMEHLRQTVALLRGELATFRAGFRPEQAR